MTCRDDIITQHVAERDAVGLQGLDACVHDCLQLYDNEAAARGLQQQWRSSAYRCGVKTLNSVTLIASALHVHSGTRYIVGAGNDVVLNLT